MSEDEFDLSAMKKKSKKKKKKVDFEFDDDAAAGTETDPAQVAGADDDAAAASTSATSAAAAAAPAADAGEKDKDDDINFDGDLEFGGKEKKKKKPVATDDDAAAAGEEKEKKSDAAPAGGDDLGEIDLDDDFSMKKKKKKKKPAAGEAGEDASSAPAASTTTQQPQQPDREYTYQELLERVFDIMRQRNPDMVAGEKKRFVMKPPQVVRIGAKKTSFVNFPDICKTLRRLPDHLLGFILAELGTSGSVDGSNALVIKGRFTQKQLESVLKRYIREYVTCHTCKSPDSILRKENRLFFLLCETCGSKCSVASIKSGFQAVTGRRAAMRANAPN